MKSIIPKRVLTLAGLILFAGCQRSIPQEQTSLAMDPGKNPGAPPKTMTMVWHHHSTGDRILKGGLRDALEKNNITFYDINYSEAAVDGYVIGDHTDPVDFPKNFNTPAYFDVIKSWELKEGKPAHDIVMFKSCYPASNIKTDAMFKEYQNYYTSLLPTFKKHPEILFIGMSTPPLVKVKTTPEAAKRAREWSKWVTTEYAKDLPNVQVFDLFNALAIAEGNPDENTLVPQFAESSDDSHPIKAGAQAVTRMFIPWFNRTVRQAGFVK